MSMERLCEIADRHKLPRITCFMSPGDYIEYALALMMVELKLLEADKVYIPPPLAPRK